MAIFLSFFLIFMETKFSDCSNQRQNHFRLLFLWVFQGVYTLSWGSQFFSWWVWLSFNWGFRKRKEVQGHFWSRFWRVFFSWGGFYGFRPWCWFWVDSKVKLRPISQAMNKLGTQHHRLLLLVCLNGLDNSCILKTPTVYLFIRALFNWSFWQVRNQSNKWFCSFPQNLSPNCQASRLCEGTQFCETLPVCQSLEARSSAPSSNWIFYSLLLILTRPNPDPVTTSQWSICYFINRDRNAVVK